MRNILPHPKAAPSAHVSKKTNANGTTPPETVLERVRAAWQKAGHFSGDGTKPQNVAKLVKSALAELDDCIEALGIAEQALSSQNDVLEAFVTTLKEKDLRYKALLNAIPSAILSTDADGIIRAANPAAAKLLGTGIRYMVGRPFVRYARKGESKEFQSAMGQALENDVWEPGLNLKVRKGLAAVNATVFNFEDQQGKRTYLFWLIQFSVV